MQAKRTSFLEAILNSLSGILIAYVVMTYIISPVYGLNLTTSTSAQIVAWMTTVSILRSYIWRRLFNHVESTGHVAYGEIGDPLPGKRHPK